MAERALYLDSSALVKLVVEEPETHALGQAVAGRDLISSEIALAEVQRAIRRLFSGRRNETREALSRAMESVLGALAFVPVDRKILLQAGSFHEMFLRTLDAIHAASALAVADDIEWFVTYDGVQGDAVEVAGLPLLQPS